MICVSYEISQMFNKGVPYIFNKSAIMPSVHWAVGFPVMLQGCGKSALKTALWLQQELWFVRTSVNHIFHLCFDLSWELLDFSRITSVKVLRYKFAELSSDAELYDFGIWNWNSNHTWHRITHNSFFVMSHCMCTSNVLCIQITTFPYLDIRQPHAGY